jgi:hypothetical protein
MSNSEFDVILVGSGTCGATIARELAGRNKKVLLLEQGADSPLKETLSGLLSVGREFPVGNGLKATAAAVVGGSTSLYFGVCKLPTAETFTKLGIDLSGELEEVKRELPIAELPDEFLAPQSIIVRDSARQLGYPFKKNLMLVDQSQCLPGRYCYEAKWKARSYVAEAVSRGATLITRAAVQRVAIENGQAVGVEYRKRVGIRSKLCRVYGKKIVLSAGPLATAKLLMDCGVKNVGDGGFFCKPAFMVFGTVPRLKGKEAFLGYLDFDLGNGVSIGDGTMNSSLFKLVMLSNFKWRHIFSHSRCIAVGVLMSDSISGEIREGGRYHKQLTQEELAKLQAADEIATRILRNAGAKNIFRTRLVGGIPGGVLRIRDHLDENMQTRIANLHVCDHSLISDVKITPTITLICLGRYLAKRLSATL